jgi:hypothetical protein
MDRYRLTDQQTNNKFLKGMMGALAPFSYLVYYRGRHIKGTKVTNNFCLDEQMWISKSFQKINKSL